MDLEIRRPTTNPRNGSGTERTRSDLTALVAVDHNLNQQIEALIPRLTRYARVLTRDTVAADDFVQDCLARALEKIHLWQQGTDLRAWLFTILHNEHVSLSRRDARQRARVELQQSHLDVALAPKQTVRLELRDVERAIARLPEEQRAVILLVGRDGMRYDEAASLVNLPVGTVRSRVSRGREALRAMTGLFPSRYSRRAGRAANLQPASPRLQDVFQ
jgi:RNA polymerase sigma-70 factor (ECF subfamily)